MNQKIITKTIWILLPLVLASATFYIFQNNSKVKKESEKYSERYWEQNNVEFCGIVQAKKHIERGFGFICMEKTFSNRTNDDSLYVDNKVFVYQIKGKKILFVTEVASLKIGDSVCFNINQNMSEVRYRNGKLDLKFENRIIYSNLLFPKGFICE